jgi:hypothetical protein
MGGRDPFVMKAIRNVVGRQSSEQWWAMPPSQRTQAIYAEIRRLDAETLQRSMEEHRSPERLLIYAGVEGAS